MGEFGAALPILSPHVVHLILVPDLGHRAGHLGGEMPRADGVSKVTKMNQYAMHNMVEYIKAQPDFPFDVLDVEESLEAILGYFGFHPQLNISEREELRRDLYPMALNAELGEMQHLMEAGAVSALDDVGQPLKIWLNVLGRQPRSVSPAQFMEKMRLA